MPLLNDISGQRFGRWTVIERAPNCGRYVQWLCRCDCGKTNIISSSNLVTGRSRSCGCLHTEVVSTHGKTGTPEHKAWAAMKSRCYTKSNVGYPYYGGRGIAICKRWRNSFADFLADMGQKPTPQHTLDRIDPNGDYCLANCRWANRETQDNNKRDSHPVTLHGKTQTIAQWAREYGISKSTIFNRLNHGWSTEDAITLPPK